MPRGSLQSYSARQPSGRAQGLPEPGPVDSTAPQVAGLHQRHAGRRPPAGGAQERDRSGRAPQPREPGEKYVLISRPRHLRNHLGDRQYITAAVGKSRSEKREWDEGAKNTQKRTGLLG